MERASTGACTQVHFNLGLGARLRLREPGESARRPDFVQDGSLRVRRDCGDDSAPLRAAPTGTAQ